MKARDKFAWSLPRRNLTCGALWKAARYFMRCPKEMVGRFWLIARRFTPSSAALMLRVPASHESLARKYFSLDHPLEAIYAGVSFRSFQPRRRAHMPRVSAFSGSRSGSVSLRLSPRRMKQVAHIRQISLHLRALYGEKIPGSRVNAYPSAASAQLRQWRRNCENAGWAFEQKASWALRTSSASGEIDLGSLAEQADRARRASSFACCLVWGAKWRTACCFSPTSDSDAVPVDVWIARILRAMHKKTSSLLELEQFSNSRFGSYAGYIQQYLFHHARVSKTLPA